MDYRAAYWIAEDSQSDIVLTTETEAHLPDDELLARARDEAQKVGLDLSQGRLVIGDYAR